MNSSDNPRELGGDIAGPGGPYDKSSVIFDTRNSVILDATDVAMFDNPSDGRRIAGAVLQGRVNRSEDRTRVLYIFNGDGAAALVTQLIGLAGREGGDFAREFQESFERRMKEMP